MDSTVGFVKDYLYDFTKLKSEILLQRYQQFLQGI